KELLAKSFLDLAKSRPLDKIVIKDITNHCSMTRESFYYHFSDRYELMFWIYEEQIKNMIEDSLLKEPIIKVWARSLQMMKKHLYYYKKALEDEIYFRLILESFIHNITYCIESQNFQEELSNPDIQFAIRFYANGLLNMTSEWIFKGAKEDEIVLSKRMCVIMPNILMKYYIF
ncbi:MAG TPA: hypothetical protein GX707_00250, partial [Epulopiscium sp.]|nr:hypothetical protein [Candidatus Epulonipiscium sp.]